MKNRAKCKLCGSIIESFHGQDDVHCKCGHIFVYGGNSMQCGAIDWKNFLRVDDQGNEIIVTVKDDVKLLDMPLNKPDKKELFGMLNDMINNIENLPQHAATAPVTNYDLASSLLLISSILHAIDDA